MSDSAVDFLLENLMQLINCDDESILVERDQIKSLYEELRFLREFLKHTEEKRYEHEILKNLVAEIIDVAYEAENKVDLFVFNAVNHNDRSLVGEIGHSFDPILNLSGVMEEIESIKMELMAIYENKMYDIGDLQTGKSFYGGSSRASSTAIVNEEIVVGFDEEAMKIIEQLTGEQKQLEVISIVGMGGLGKTTLARKVFNDPLIVYHFHIRGWACVSQAPQKRDILLGILSSIIHPKNEIYEMSNEKLCEMLKKCLMGRRYLIVLDDIWDIGVWNDLRRSFADNKNGSRILFTSRHKDVTLLARPDKPPHSPHFLTQDESWDLLQQKVFRGKSCPSQLMDIGKKIAKNCQGLPLAIVVVAGLLAKKEKTEGWWKQVAQSVSSYIVSDPEQCMGTLAISYNHLPHHLKACFLYFGAFPEDYEIPVWKLISLWVAEGFIRKNEQKSLEKVAEVYLMDLIDRSLVVVSRKRLDGRIKSCCMHDLLRDLCLRKAKEENFLQHIYRHEQLSQFSSSVCRLGIHFLFRNNTSLKPYALHVRSLFYSDSDIFNRKSISFVCQTFKLLRVLVITVHFLDFFPKQIEQLVHLRYLEIFACDFAISKLWNLETLIINDSPLSRWMKLPIDIWKMVKLRHLYTSKFTFIKPPRVLDDDYPFICSNLQTICGLELSSEDEDEEVLARIPNLRKLKCVSLSKWFPKIYFLVHLETLSVYHREFLIGPVRFHSTDEFPANLRKLTLTGSRLPWTEMSTLGRLPSLEVLKLLYGACEGPRWDTIDGEFVKLKVLKLELLYIEQWNSSSSHFPNLQRLKLDKCKSLKEIPYGLGDIPTLEMIELCNCSHSAAISARQIGEQQQSMGNDELKILVYPPYEEFEASVSMSYNEYGENFCPSNDALSE